jgi:hypothetical protein
MNPMMGSVMASKRRGAKKMKPHRRGEKPKFCTNTTKKTPRAAGNIWLASIPKPQASFSPKGTFFETGVVVAMISGSGILRKNVSRAEHAIPAKTGET